MRFPIENDIKITHVEPQALDTNSIYVIISRYAFLQHAMGKNLASF